MKERHCAIGNHFKPIDHFRSPHDRDCAACVESRRAAAKKIIWMRTTRSDGVDIDAIHFKRGAVKPGVKPRA